MPFEIIENCQLVNLSSAIPPDGVRIGVRKAAARGVPTSYIKLQLGSLLAKKLDLTGEKVPVSLAFGSGKDAGKIRISVDVRDGGFIAKRDKKGNYGLTINRATADGLFAGDFPTFSRSEVEVHNSQGTPPAAIFSASEEMLAVD